MRPAVQLLLAAAIALGAAACTAASPTPPPSVVPTPIPTPTPTATATATATASVEPPASASPSAPPAPPTATPEPALSLDLPEGSDPRVVAVSVTPDVGAEGGTFTVVVTSLASDRIDELVMRWPTELEASLRLAPFAPSEARYNDSAPPLDQDWTKWVIGPGEHGEPAGTISVGWGPLFPGATLEIPLVVTRLAAGPVAFDFQLLAGNDLLTMEGGVPAELRIEVP